MKKKIYFAVMAAVTAAALCMTGCGDTEETAGTTAEESTTEELAATAEVTEAAETTGTEEAATEATEAAPEVTFAEENGIEYSDERTFAISGAAMFTDENGDPTEYAGMSIVNYESTFTFGEATVSEPDSDGMVTITVSATESSPYDLLYDWSVDYPDWHYNNLLYGPSLFDTYTGLVFESSMYDDASVAAATDITYDGVTYTVTVAQDIEWNYTNGEWEDDYSEEVSRIAIVAEVQLTYTITVPQDYDGLCFAFWPVHEVEADDISSENTASIERTLEENLAEDGYTLDDITAYVKVSDLLAE